jgi:cytochrome c oxidase subunit 1
MSAEGHDHGHDHEHEHHHKETFITKYIFSLIINDCQAISYYRYYSWNYRCRLSMLLECNWLGQSSLLKYLMFIGDKFASDGVWQ